MPAACSWRRASSAPPASPAADVAVSPGPGGPQYVALFDTNNDNTTATYVVTPYPGFGGGVTVAEASEASNLSANFLITAPGPLGGPDVRFYDGQSLQPTVRFNAYDPAFLGGVFVG